MKQRTAIRFDFASGDGQGRTNPSSVSFVHVLYLYGPKSLFEWEKKKKSDEILYNLFKMYIQLWQRTESHAYKNKTLTTDRLRTFAMHLL